MRNLLKFLLILQVMISYGTIYYDDEEAIEEEEDLTADVDDIDIELDDTIFQMLITGGYRPTTGETFTQYLASIRTNHPSEWFGDNHYCAGTIIGYKMILTAAHCILTVNKLQRRAKRIKIYLGTPNRLRKTRYTVQRSVSDIFIHPRFKHTTHHDIAILIVDTDVPFSNPMVEILNLPTQRPKPGTSCITLGWGQIIHNGPIAAEAVYVSLEVLEPSKCRHWLKDFQPDSELCVGDTTDPEKAICRGDSGSPLICDNKLAGIVSSNVRCDDNFSTSVFTDVFAHIDWIYQIQNSQVQIAMSILLLLDCLLIALVFFFF